MHYTSSEWVSPGHPDKMADYISEYILDRYIEEDPRTRFALECQIKDNHVTLGGEITSKAGFCDDDLCGFVRKAVGKIGYTGEYASRWDGMCTDASKIECAFHVSRQSPDIARGVDNGGWGDQGIFWGMATDTPETSYMPRDAFMAREIGRRLYNGRVAGIDIKTQVTIMADKRVDVVVAMPIRHGDGLPLMRIVHDVVESVLAEYMGDECKANIVVNGTGSFVTHGSVGDCGTTGRKLAVDFYGGNCEIGGGCPWTKDGTKADLALNLYARHSALRWSESEKMPCKVALACRIGSQDVVKTVLTMDNRVVDSSIVTLPPCELIKRFGLDRPVFARLCMEGLPYAVR